MALRFTFSLADVMKLDELVKAHHRAFLKASPPQASHLARALTSITSCSRASQVPEYSGLWKPKHHFATHLAVELLRYGPLRGFWCMSFEGFNKVVKQATELSNYRNEDMFVLEHWMVKSAKVLRRMRDESWCSSGVSDDSA